MPDFHSTLASRYRAFCSSIPSNVQILAVSKGHPASSIRYLTELGQRDFGESRLQEALPKLEQLGNITKLDWHFVGRIQSNKARGVVKNFDTIHSVDSQKLAERINRIAQEENKNPSIFFQVKFLKDISKTGFSPEELEDSWPGLKNLSHLKIVGLMTIPPKGIEYYQRKNLFKSCRKFADSLTLPECSMGMSSDWKEALDEGSTCLRLGAGLFGPRSMPTQET